MKKISHIAISRKVNALLEIGKSKRDIADSLEKSVIFVEQCKALKKLSPKVKKWVDNGLKYFDAYRLVVLPHDQQEIFAQKIMEKGFEIIKEELKRVKIELKQNLA